MNDNPDETASKDADFERESQEADISFLAEFVLFLKENKKWWMAPILLVFGGLAVVAILSSTAAAPFIYSLF